EVLINYNGDETNMDPLWFLDDYEERMQQLKQAEQAAEREKNAE
ncbi:SET domain-containing protein-lysine N-methyltransferase, partial [Escherichia coli]|nr:SET domain-containing protein-lysine N-methyltransferase [Escherichia coli]